VETLTEMLAPTFHLRQPLGPVLAGEDRALLRLTEEQFGVLDLLARERRVAVSGGAGTGKTILALEKAKRLAAEGSSTFRCATISAIRSAFTR
jgi:MoxR-like ATPase